MRSELAVLQEPHKLIARTTTELLCPKSSEKKNVLSYDKVYYNRTKCNIIVHGLISLN
jgi:hypothetical protein